VLPVFIQTLLFGRRFRNPLPGSTYPGIFFYASKWITICAMAKATWKGTVLAESDQYHVVEGNIYFPPDAVKRAYFKPSDTHTTCPWKGIASYYDLIVNGEANKDAAWYYPEPKEAAKNITGYIAFWKGVEVTE